MLKINNTSNTRLLESWVHTSREHDVYGTTQASFLAKFKATRNKPGQKRHRYSFPNIFCALRYNMKHR